MPAALLAALAMIAATTSLPALDSAALLLRPVLVVPDLSLPALVGIALPLFIVTIASQNIPGIAVLSANGYAAVPGPLVATTGVFSLRAAPFVGHTRTHAASGQRVPCL